MRFSWPNRCSLGSSPGSRHLVKSKMPGQMDTESSTGACPRVCTTVRSTPSPMMPWFCVTDGADQFRRQFQHGIVLEFGFETLAPAVPRGSLRRAESGFPVHRGRADRLDLDGLARRLRRRDDRLGSEVKRDAEHVRIFNIEKSLFVQVVGLPAQRRARSPVRKEAACRRRGRPECG